MMMWLDIFLITLVCQRAPFFFHYYLAVIFIFILLFFCKRMISYVFAFLVVSDFCFSLRDVSDEAFFFVIFLYETEDGHICYCHVKGIVILCIFL